MYGVLPWYLSWFLYCLSIVKWWGLKFLAQGLVLPYLYTASSIIFACPKSQFATITISSIPLGRAKDIFLVWDGDLQYKENACY